MLLLDTLNLENYLRRRGIVADGETIRATELTGGVSNALFRIERSGGEPFVLKQAREQLRTEQEWRCDVRRIEREIDVLKICREIIALQPETEEGWNLDVPAILFEDRENFAYAMTAAPPEHETWKQRLLSGRVEPTIAAACGRLLGRLHRMSYRDGLIADSCGDRKYFEALRVEPYYRRIAEVHPQLAPEIELLIDSVMRHQITLVHGDFSPKNLLVYDQRLMLIDFEVGHFGDPAFDNGFFLAHLVLKAIWSDALRGDYVRLIPTFWKAYRAQWGDHIDDQDWLALEERSVFNLAGCLLARVDGKSPVDYLDEDHRRQVRDLAYHLFRAPPETVEEVHRMVE